MNIFALSYNPKEAAQFHCDKHVVKMITEYNQLLSTTQSVHGLTPYYRPCYVNHPCRKWLDESKQNYLWLCRLTSELCKEYTYRYGRKHKGEGVLVHHILNVPQLPLLPMTPFACAMPKECILDDPVLSYRNYYNTYKRHLFKWKKREIPLWITEDLCTPI